jgi:hypothetical protein
MGTDGLIAYMMEGVLSSGQNVGEDEGRSSWLIGEAVADTGYGENQIWAAGIEFHFLP